MKDLKASDIMMRPVISAKRNASARDVTLQFLSGLKLHAHTRLEAVILGKRFDLT